MLEQEEGRAIEDVEVIHANVLKHGMADVLLPKHQEGSGHVVAGTAKHIKGFPDVSFGLAAIDAEMERRHASSDHVLDRDVAGPRRLKLLCADPCHDVIPERLVLGIDDWLLLDDQDVVRANALHVDKLPVVAKQPPPRNQVGKR